MTLSGQKLCIQLFAYPRDRRVTATRLNSILAALGSATTAPLLDTEFEKRGRDYPAEYVRWTERRNVAAFLQLLAEQRVDIRPLVTRRYAIDDARRAYDELLGESGRAVIGAVFNYRGPAAAAVPQPEPSVAPVPLPPRSGSGRAGAAVVGCGTFARALFQYRYRFFWDGWDSATGRW